MMQVFKGLGLLCLPAVAMAADMSNPMNKQTKLSLKNPEAPNMNDKFITKSSKNNT
jgi:hypothetical protein